MGLVMLTKTEKPRKVRRDRPAAPRLQVNLSVDPSVFERIARSAKTNFRTVSMEVCFRLKRDLDCELQRAISNPEPPPAAAKAKP
jgi:hypothetical protein